MRAWNLPALWQQGLGTVQPAGFPGSKAAHARAQLHVSLILSVVAATTLRTLEVLLGALFPGMPRYAIVRQLTRFIAGAPGATLLHVPHLLRCAALEWRALGTRPKVQL